MKRNFQLLTIILALAFVAAACELEEGAEKPERNPWGVERRVVDDPDETPRRDRGRRPTTTVAEEPGDGDTEVGEEKEPPTSDTTTTLPSTTLPPTVPPTSDTTTTLPSTTLPPTTVPSTSVPTTTAAPGPTVTLPPPTGEVMFFEDFVGSDAMSRFDIGIFHRDDSVVAAESWLGDHASTGPDDLCGPPTEKRTITRGDRASGFNDDWIYRCVPGGDTAKAHVMTSIGDTSGYSLGAFAPTTVFTGVREVRWDVNQTDLGDRQWTEIAIIPADVFDFQNLPCTADVPCATTTHDVLGSVGTQWSGLKARKINTPEGPNGYLQAGGELGYRCDGCPYAPSMRYGGSYGQGDPALTSIAIRRTNFFRDNGDGTLTWGLELDDGTFNEFTAPGSFPTGPVRIVFKDHNYTPLKSPATLLPETTFSWHWDNIGVYG